MKIQTTPEMPLLIGDLLLLVRWRDQSMRDGWRYARDWFVPEVEEMSSSLMHEVSSDGPAQRLGASRWFHGVGIAETMADLQSLYTVAGLPVDQGAMQKVAVGWVEACEREQPSSCTDVTSGLVTPAHFERVIHDARRTADGANDLALGTMSFPCANQRLRADWTLAAEIGLICAQQFTGESAIQVYHHGRVDFLIQSSPADFADALRCKALLELLRNGVLGPAELRYRSIRSTETDAMSRTAQLRNAAVRWPAP